MLIELFVLLATVWLTQNNTTFCLRPDSCVLMADKSAEYLHVNLVLVALGKQHRNRMQLLNFHSADGIVSAGCHAFWQLLGCLPVGSLGRLSQAGCLLISGGVVNNYTLGFLLAQCMYSVGNERHFCMIGLWLSFGL